MIRVRHCLFSQLFHTRKRRQESDGSVMRLSTDVCFANSVSKPELTSYAMQQALVRSL